MAATNPMAEDAFALSPIEARPALPTEADYEAICSAFMETARGRWFLGEYAKRNRNADTRLVLDAVSRIEAALADQQATPEQSLAALLPTIGERIADARKRILAALPKHDLKRAIEPIQRVATVLREVAWAMRESGADTRICDLLDVQAKAIVDACARILGDQAAASDAPAAIGAVLDSLSRQIDTLAAAPDDATGPAAPVRPATTQPGPATLVTPAHTPASAKEPPVAKRDAASPPAESETASSPTAAAPESEAKAGVGSGASGALPSAVEEPPHLWHDLEITDTILPTVALAAPERPSPAAISAAITDTAPQADAAVPDVIAASAAPAEATGEDTAGENGKKPAAPSLGSAALQSGIVPGASSRHLALLAPLRRMSQAERIAFFS